jgi:hypothetical protein
MAVTCTVCRHVRRGEIDTAIHALTSFRMVGRTFGVPKDTIARHARAHCGITETPAQATENARRRSERKVAASVVDVKPIETAEDVVEDLQWLRVEAMGLFEQAKARSDWKSAERLFSQLVAVTDRFGEMHKVLGPKGSVTVSIDRSSRVMNVIGAMSEDDLRKLLARAEAGETIALPTSEVIDAG